MRGRTTILGERPDIAEGGRFLAMLIHGPRRKRKDQPGFVDLVIPNRRLNGYICRVQLFQEFPKIAEEMVTRPATVKVQRPRLRKNRREATDE